MIDQGWASAPEDTANSNTAEAPSGPSRCSATSMPNTWAHTQTLNSVPRAMPIAARLHSAGRVLIAAGNQRASIEGVHKQQAKKKAYQVARKSPLKVPTSGGGTRTVCRPECQSANAY